MLHFAVQQTAAVLVGHLPDHQHRQGIHALGCGMAAVQTVEGDLLSCQIRHTATCRQSRIGDPVVILPNMDAAVALREHHVRSRFHGAFGQGAAPDLRPGIVLFQAAEHQAVGQGEAGIPRLLIPGLQAHTVGPVIPAHPDQDHIRPDLVLVEIAGPALAAARREILLVRRPGHPAAAAGIIHQQLTAEEIDDLAPPGIPHFPDAGLLPAGFIVEHPAAPGIEALQGADRITQNGKPLAEIGILLPPFVVGPGLAAPVADPSAGHHHIQHTRRILGSAHIAQLLQLPGAAEKLGLKCRQIGTDRIGIAADAALDGKHDPPERLIPHFAQHPPEGLRHHLGRIFESAAAEGTQDQHLRFIFHSRFQHIPDPLAEQIFQGSLVYITSFCQIGGRAGDHIHLKPLLLFQSLRHRCVVLKHRNIRGVDQPVGEIVVRLLLLIAVEVLENPPVLQTGVQVGAAAQALLLGHGTLEHTAAGIVGIGKIQHRHPTVTEVLPGSGKGILFQNKDLRLPDRMEPLTAEIFRIDPAVFPGPGGQLRQFLPGALGQGILETGNSLFPAHNSASFAYFLHCTPFCPDAQPKTKPAPPSVSPVPVSRSGKHSCG